MWCVCALAYMHVCLPTCLFVCWFENVWHSINIKMQNVNFFYNSGLGKSVNLVFAFLFESMTPSPSLIQSLSFPLSPSTPSPLRHYSSHLGKMNVFLYVCYLSSPESSQFWFYFQKFSETIIFSNVFGVAGWFFVSFALPGDTPSTRGLPLITSLMLLLSSSCCNLYLCSSVWSQALLCCWGWWTLDPSAECWDFRHVPLCLIYWFTGSFLE